MKHLDPRLNAVRPDLADIRLSGQVEAARLVEGKPARVVAPQAPVRRFASPDAQLLTEALCGELVTIFEKTDEGWAWAQLVSDRYVGWLPREALSENAPAPTHKVSTLRTLIFPGPDIKLPPMAGLPFGALVTVTGEAEDKNARYALIVPAGAVVTQHLAPLDIWQPDWIAVAEQFTGTPYLWGGKTSLGIDCSGLLQTALHAGGIAAPRDSDMQEESIGDRLDLGSGLPPLRRGDLVFWKGHVGIMRDGENLLHANAHHMAVASEPLSVAMERLERQGLRPTSLRRISPH